jgi:Uncharacterized conserved protein (DUF2190)
MIQGTIKSYEASATVDPYTIAIFSEVSTTRRVAEATSNTVPAIGVFGAIGGVAGDIVDVHLSGLASVKLGGTVTAGQPLMSDANGNAIAAVAAAATTRRIIGFAHEPGVSGDIIDVWLAPGLLHQG